MRPRTNYAPGARGFADLSVDPELGVGSRVAVPPSLGVPATPPSSPLQLPAYSHPFLSQQSNCAPNAYRSMLKRGWFAPATFVPTDYFSPTPLSTLKPC